MSSDNFGLKVSNMHGNCIVIDFRLLANSHSQFDKNGNTGGCQATYTVIPPASIDPVSCPNVTFPAGPLDIEAVVVNGPMSQFGWIDQVSDLYVSYLCTNYDYSAPTSRLHPKTERRRTPLQ